MIVTGELNIAGLDPSRFLNFLFIVLTILHIGCSSDKHERSTATPSALERLRVSYAEKLPLLQGWPSDTDCDGSLWAGLARRAGVESADIALALQPDGRPTRRPSVDCGPIEEGLAGDSASTVSNDMILGIIVGLHESKNLEALERLWEYGQANAWVMGKPITMLSRVLLKPSGIGLLAQTIYVLGGKDHEERKIPNPVLPVQADYEEHLQIIGAKLAMNIGRSESLPDTCTTRPSDALIQGICGNENAGAELLLGDYSYPTYVRGGDGVRYQLTHWLLAAKIIIENSIAKGYLR